jgi:ribosomal protein S18 acetylase RimI-like enzyme
MNIVVREIEVRDVQAVRLVTWETWLATYGSIIPEHDIRNYFDEHYSISALTELFKNPDTTGYIIEVDDRIAGFIRTEYVKKENRFYLSSLYILPEFQGGGLGRKLLEVAEAKARWYNLDRVWLAVMTTNATALAWYTKLGFTFIEDLPFAVGKTLVTHRIGYRRIHTESVQS